ncbi:unnamed protein product, partial [Allacma fusca]
SRIPVVDLTGASQASFPDDSYDDVFANMPLEIDDSDDYLFAAVDLEAIQANAVDDLDSVAEDPNHPQPEAEGINTKEFVPSPHPRCGNPECFSLNPCEDCCPPSQSSVYTNGTPRSPPPARPQRFREDCDSTYECTWCEPCDACLSQALRERLANPNLPLPLPDAQPGGILGDPEDLSLNIDYGLLTPDAVNAA